MIAMLYDRSMEFGVSRIMGRIYQFLSRKSVLTRFGAILACFVVVAVLMSGTHVYADQPYNSGNYGDCAYSKGCDPTVPPTTVVPVPPSTQNPQAGRAFSVNIINTQVFNGKNYDVVATPNFPADQINSVEFYVGDQLVGMVTEPDNGAYVISWQLPKDGDYTVKVLMHLKDGSTITKEFSVIVSQKSESTGTAQDSGQSPNGDSTGSSSFLFGIFSPINTFLQNIVQVTPKAVAYALPYMFFVLLGILLIVLVYQTRNQLHYIGVLLKLLERDKQLADEKANFIMLASHYIRTPLTILAGTIDLALMDHADDPLLQQSKISVNELHVKAEQILNDVQQNKDLLNIKKPDIGRMRTRLYRSWSLILPIVLSATLVIGINVLYISARRINLVIPSIIMQIVIFVVLSGILVVLLQRHQQRRDEYRRVKQQRDYEEALDKARNEFIRLSAEELTPRVRGVKANFEESTILQTSPQINDAITQLEGLIYRFVLVTELEHGKIAKSLSEFDIMPTTKQVMDEFDTTISVKKLQVLERLSGLQLHQSRALLQYVVRMLMDNAIKFSPQDGKVLVATAPHGRQKASIIIRNSGQPIEKEKLERLFQPFSRNQSAQVFNEGGVGLSLYLARLIMRYLGGDVDLESDAVKTTTAKVTLPRSIKT